jgi:hypothetical protein
MPPLAPTITQIVPTTGAPTPAGTPVADLAQPGGEVDPGPFTYAILTDPGAAYVVNGAQLDAAIDLDGAFFVEVTVDSAGGTSPAGSATLTFADNLNAWDDQDAHYADNPQIPPLTPEDEKWKMFLRQAVLTIVPRARFGIDFMVARETGKFSGQAIIDWDDTVLGTCPTPEIEAYAKQLSAEWPWSTLGEPPARSA